MRTQEETDGSRGSFPVQSHLLLLSLWLQYPTLGGTEMLDWDMHYNVAVGSCSVLS